VTQREVFEDERERDGSNIVSSRLCLRVREEKMAREHHITPGNKKAKKSDKIQLRMELERTAHQEEQR
jgi:hypothetical protein